MGFGLLCHRLKEKRTWGKSGIWIKDFFTNRVQWIIANDKKSLPSYIKSGVPQGTVLGPLLFLLIIDSLGEMNLEALLSSFADDSKISVTIDNEDDAYHLQECLEKLNNWQENNNMKFNTK